MKRSRAPNFTTAEIMLLLRLVEMYPVIENKRTDGTTAREKQEAWQALAEQYNSLTNYSPRTADNLLACYKNQKIRVKKKHSNEKMALKAPLLLQAVEDHGQDWERVAQATNDTSAECQTAFNLLVAASKKEDASHKRELSRTGGGPVPQPSCSNGDRGIMEKVKSLIGPSLEGMYTIYDGDAEFMKEQQLSQPAELQICPVEDEPNITEYKENISDICITPVPVQSTSKKELTRLNLMKKKIDPSLEAFKKEKKKPVSTSFQELAEEKKEMVKIQRKLYEVELEIAREKLEFIKKKNVFELETIEYKNRISKQIELDIAKEKIDFIKKTNDIEAEFLRKKKEMELKLIK